MENSLYSNGSAIRPIATVLGMGSAGAPVPGSLTDKVSQGRWCEHRGGSGRTPDTVAVVGAHLSSGSMMRGKKGGDSSTFQGGGVVRWTGRMVMRSYS
jgi:hypothetical protein